MLIFLEYFQILQTGEVGAGVSASTPVEAFSSLRLQLSFLTSGVAFGTHSANQDTGDNHTAPSGQSVEMGLSRALENSWEGSDSSGTYWHLVTMHGGQTLEWNRRMKEKQVQRDNTRSRVHAVTIRTRPRTLSHVFLFKVTFLLVSVWGELTTAWN